MLTTVAEKEHLRQTMLGQRSRMAFEEVYRLSLEIQARFVRGTEFRLAKKLALYASFKNEVLTDEIFSRALEAGKEVYFPRIVRGGPHLAFYRVNGKEELQAGSYKILEPPEVVDEAAPATLECVVVPGVAFDANGARLGYGKGYYDRFLKKTRCPVVALAFGFQLLSRPLPEEPHDVTVNSIVTESGIIRV
ncbi:MAG: 5-formyltetrahydrofolate cyclo-ligase [Deltaproteobacteria bacterium]|nr:5-formyltetrahydrofolate cyclo-ligase [Deltaproteobacteria bacterium]